MIATCSALRVFERIILVVPAIGRMAATYAVGLQLEDAYLKPELGLIRGLTAAEKDRIVNLPYEKRSTAKAYVRPGDKDSLRIFRKTAAGAENGDGAYEVCWDRQQRAAFIATHELSGAFDFDDAQHLQVRREGREGGMQGGGVQQAQGLRFKSAHRPSTPHLVLLRHCDVAGRRRLRRQPGPAVFRRGGEAAAWRPRGEPMRDQGDQRGGWLQDCEGTASEGAGGAACVQQRGGGTGSRRGAGRAAATAACRWVGVARGGG